MAEQLFGEITGIIEGATFLDRKQLREAGIHRDLVAGIDGNPRAGASSIVLNGGYVDDYDLGEEILYTGHGGNKDGKQIADQTWDARGNKALIVSELNGLPVRVTRGAEHKSPYSPSSGYQYGGLYQVIDHFSERGEHGYLICRYRLQKQSQINNNKEAQESKLPGSKGETRRVETTTLRIVRDTTISKAVKKLYNHTCQVCGMCISVRGVPYAEGAHIKPLGKPHNGNDESENILCLCPNHHVMFDKGVFAIDEEFYLVGIEGRLTVHKKHMIDIGNLLYHKEHIFINDQIAK